MMEDAKYLFIQTEKERKRTARGDRNKKRGGGKICRFPSDNMTRKERNALNGEVKTYQMNKPLRWGELLKFPDDIKAAYILGLEDKYSVGSKEISEMLGISRPTLCKWRKFWNCNAEVGTHKHPDFEAWKAFLNGGTETEQEQEQEQKQEQEQEQEQETLTVTKTKEFKETNNIAQILALLAGTGAEITIKITL